MRVFRQGEIIIREVAPINLKATRSEYDDSPKLINVGHTVIREGEATGHEHKLTSGMLLADTPYSHRYSKPTEAELKKLEPRFIHLESDTTLTHDEHDTLKIPKGDYEITIQREYDDVNKWRYVAD